MHDAYDLSQLLKLTVQIESIAACDDFLLIGTKQGHLLTYSVGKKLGEHKHSVQLLSYNKHFSKKPIQQLDVIPACQLIVSLSDNVVSVHNINKVRSQATTSSSTVLLKTRGATLFTLDITNEKTLTGAVSVLVRLCVVVKRKLQFYYWKKGEFLEFQEDITIPDVPRSMVWCHDAICLGYKSEYSLLNFATKKFSDLFPTGKAPEPITTRVDKEVFALAKDSQCIFMNTSGALTLKYAVKFADIPVAVVYDNPYLIALLPDAVEIKSIDPNQFIQSITLSRANLITRARSGMVFIANQSLIWCLQAVPVPQQIKALLEDKRFELALTLANSSDGECEEDKKKNVHSIQTLYAYHLFSAKQYQESMNQFLMLETNPQDVIKLFPDLLPPSLSQSPQKLNDRELEAGLMALIDYLTELRRGLAKTKPTEKSALLSIVDTTLLKCYLQINDAMIAPLLRLNMVHFKETERVLKEHNKISELVILYQTNGINAEALSLLKQLKDIDKTVKCLKHLGNEHLNLILTYAEWVIKENPQEGFKIFTEDTSEVELLSRPQILNFLFRTDSSLTIPYLEHCFKVWDDKNPVLHTKLADLYLERYISLQAAPESRQESLKLREKLLDFLERSDYYAKQKILERLPKEDMLEERAIILGKLGRHEGALSIYVCILEDVQRAKQYCERVWASKAPGHDKVFLLLMRILISPPENWLVGVAEIPPTSQRDLSKALEILQSNADKINPSQALSVLPDDVPLRSILPFLTTSLRNRLETRRRFQILKSLVYSEHLLVQAQRLRKEAKPILVNEHNICALCSKRFTSQSVVAFIPAGVIHYGCQRSSQI